MRGKFIGMILAGQAAAFGQAANTLTAEEQAQGFSLLFDGTMASVRSNFVAYQKNGTNVTTLPANIEAPAGKDYFWDNNATQDIRTAKMYGDFELKFDYRITDNAGLYYRANLLTNSIFENAVEYPIYNGTPVDGNWNAPGAAYDIFPPSLINYKAFATGEWNSIRVRLYKDSVYHWHNGALVLRYSLASEAFKAALVARKWANARCLAVEAASESDCDHSNPYRKTGYIGLQTGYPGSLYIRNLKVADYPFPPPVAVRAAPAPGAIAWSMAPGRLLRIAGAGPQSRYELRTTRGVLVASSAGPELAAPGPGLFLLSRVGAGGIRSALVAVP